MITKKQVLDWYCKHQKALDQCGNCFSGVCTERQELSILIDGLIDGAPETHKIVGALGIAEWKESVKGVA